MTPAALLREARRRAGLSQRQLAERAGVTQPVVAAYEAGRNQPSVPQLARLVRAAGFERAIPCCRAHLGSLLADHWSGDLGAA